MIQVLDDKFLGVPPAVVMLEELKNSIFPWVREAVKNEGENASCLRRILVGAGDERLQGADRRLTPNEQVDALVKQAIDPAILSHAWQGWMPFL